MGRRVSIDGLADAVMQELDNYADTTTDGVKAAELEAEFAEMNGWEAEADAETLLSRCIPQHGICWPICWNMGTPCVTAAGLLPRCISRLPSRTVLKNWRRRLGGRCGMDNLISIMEEIGIPYAYDHFAEGESPEPPFVCFLCPGSDNFAADGWAYFKVDVVHIELYTDEKNPEIESRIETVLDGHGIFYDKTEVWIESERLYEVLYSFEEVKPHE